MATQFWDPRLLLDGADAADIAVWCQRGCGQNLHRECFEEWTRDKQRWEVKYGYWLATLNLFFLLILLTINVSSRAKWFWG
jgi:hypothetical protein